MTSAPRLVISGIGLVAPNGVGKTAFWNSCANRISGIKPISLFDTGEFRCRVGGEVADFDPVPHLGMKGLRNLDRTTLLVLVAAQQALDDARLEIDDNNRDEIGVVLGSTMGSVKSISDFDIEGLREGPRYVNPAHFPNTVINSPASHVAIRFGLQGLNSTISTGFNASLDAFSYAMNMLRLGRAQSLLVGGVEELCLQTFLGFYKLGLMARGTRPDPDNDPFHAAHCGTLLGEGAGMFCLESIEEAKRRRARVYAEVLGYGQQFEPDWNDRYEAQSVAFEETVAEALAEADLSLNDIDAVGGFANGIRGAQTAEDALLEKVFGYRFKEVDRLNVRPLIGESFSAGGAMQVAHALSPQRTSAGAYAAAGAVKSADSNHLILGVSPQGHMSALVLKVVNDGS